MGCYEPVLILLQMGITQRGLSLHQLHLGKHLKPFLGFRTAQRRRAMAPAPPAQLRRLRSPPAGPPLSPAPGLGPAFPGPLPSLRCRGAGLPRPCTAIAWPKPALQPRGLQKKAGSCGRRETRAAPRRPKRQAFPFPQGGLLAYSEDGP